MFDTRLDQEVAYSIIGAKDKLPNLSGMELRDLFAMNVINGICSSYTTGTPFDTKEVYENLVDWSYNIADAMLERRKK